MTLYLAGAISVITITKICYDDYGDSNQNGIPDDAEAYTGYLAVELFPTQVHIDTYHCKIIQEFMLFGDLSFQIGGYAEVRNFRETNHKNSTVKNSSFTISLAHISKSEPVVSAFEGRINFLSLGRYRQMC